MSWFLITSRFHACEGFFIVKGAYDDVGGDILAALAWEVYDKGPDIRYAKKKLAEIKSRLCGSDACQCVFVAKKTN